MNANGGLLFACLTSLLLSCGIVESSKEKRLKKANRSLQTANLELQTQLDTIGPDGAGLRQMQSKLKDIEEQLLASQAVQEQLSQAKALLERNIADLSVTDTGAKILELRNLLSETETKLGEEQRNFAKLSSDVQYYDSLIKNTLEPFWGLYISRGAPIPIGASLCRLFIYAENTGILTRALACNDGKLQWERQAMRSFDATVDDRLEGKYGFGIRSEAVASSCPLQASYLASSGDSHFERASSYGAAEFSIGMRTDLNGQALFLDNAAVNFKSSDCDDLIARAESPEAVAPEQREVLNTGAEVCKVINGQAQSKLLAGCFTDASTFVPLF